LDSVFAENGHFLAEFPFGFRFLDVDCGEFSTQLLADSRCVKGYGVCDRSEAKVEGERYTTEDLSLESTVDPRSVGCGPVELAVLTAPGGSEAAALQRQVRQLRLALHHLEPCGVVIIRIFRPKGGSVARHSRQLCTLLLRLFERVNGHAGRAPSAGEAYIVCASFDKERYRALGVDALLAGEFNFSLSPDEERAVSFLWSSLDDANRNAWREKSNAWPLTVRVRADADHVLSEAQLKAAAEVFGDVTSVKVNDSEAEMTFKDEDRAREAAEKFRSAHTFGLESMVKLYDSKGYEMKENVDDRWETPWEVFFCAPRTETYEMPEQQQQQQLPPQQQFYAEQDEQEWETLAPEPVHSIQGTPEIWAPVPQTWPKTPETWGAHPQEAPKVWIPSVVVQEPQTNGRGAYLSEAHQEPKDGKARKDAKAKDGKGKEKKTEWKAKTPQGTPKAPEAKPKENGKSSSSKGLETKEKGKGAGKTGGGKGKTNQQDLGSQLTAALAPPKAQGAPGFAGAAANGFRKRMVWADVDSNCSTPPAGMSPDMPQTRPRANPVYSKPNGTYSNQAAVSGAKWNVNPKYGPTGSAPAAAPAKITPVETPKWKVEAKYGMSSNTPTKKAPPAVELGKEAAAAKAAAGLHPTLAAHQAATAKLIAEMMGKD
jgi:hypothetical protein